MMQLGDKLEVLGDGEQVIATIRAQVGMTAIPTMKHEPTGGVTLEPEQLRALIRPTRYATTGRRYRWRGEVYKQPEEPFIRRRGDRDHHYTIKLEKPIT